jgi:hypothetical protein
MTPQESAAQLANTTPMAGQFSSDPLGVPSMPLEVGEGPACRPMLCECPLGCGHAHVEHPHLNMMHE